MLRRYQNTAGNPPGRSGWPSITALPRSPGHGPSLYHPASTHGFWVGVAMSPLASVPTCSIGAFIPMVGTLKRTGCEPSIAARVVVTGGVLAIPEPTRSGGSMGDG